MSLSLWAQEKSQCIFKCDTPCLIALLLFTSCDILKFERLKPLVNTAPPRLHGVFVNYSPLSLLLL